MSRSIHFISGSIRGYGPSDSRCLPCSGVSGRAMSISPNSSHSDCKLTPNVKLLPLRYVSRQRCYVCKASSSNYRRNSDFSRQNKQGFSRNRNRHNDEKDGYEDLEESETFNSQNGTLLSVSANRKFQATATPGPREKEIVELFRKVQAQLRERAAKKEERKVEDSQGKSKESDTVDSLLKLLRKHSVQQGKKNSNSGKSEFSLDHPESVRSSVQERSTSISDSDITVKHEMQERLEPNPSRPKSNFRKRSPVPEVKFQPVYSDGPLNSASEDNLDLEPETDDINELKIESEVEPLFSEGSEFDEMSEEDETSVIYESEHEDGVEEQEPVETCNLSGMKLTDLRALAKSRGMKGFSKLKKNELIELLGGTSV